MTEIINALPGVDGEPGISLRRAREAQGKTVEEVADAIKLSVRQIQAIEANQFDRLRGPTFARGFVRNYARFLGVDAESLLAHLDAPEGGVRVELEPVSNARGRLPELDSERKGLAPAVALVVLVAGAAALGWYLDWYRPVQQGLPPAESLSGQGTRAEKGENVLPPTPPVVSAPGTASGNDSAGSPSAQVGAPVATPAAPVTAPPSAPPAAIEPAAPVSVAPPPVASSPVPPSTVAPLPAPSLPDGAGTVAAPGTKRLTLTFSQESWVEVRDGKGKVLFSKLNAPGSTQVVDGEGAMSLIVGNANGVTLNYAGKPVDLQPHIKGMVARLKVE